LIGYPATIELFELKIKIMAKVDSINIQFKGQYKQYEVHFTKTSQFYIKDCPGEVIEYGEFDNRKTTLGEIKDRFRDAVIKADEFLMTSRKVILVKFSMASQIISEPCPSGGQSYSHTHPLARFCSGFENRFDGYGFAIDYRIAIEVSRGVEKLYYNQVAADLTYRRGCLHVKDNETAIHYSDKAIETLENIISSMKNMVFSISGFFSDVERLKISLETGNLKMLN
jgi:hypothetical protein